MKPLQLEFTASKPKIEVIAGKDGKKKAIIMGTLMNSKYNENNWRSVSEDLQKMASKFKGNPLKMQHSDDDFNVVGQGLEAFYDTNTDDLNYKSESSNPKVIEKFENGEWTAENMGVSPKVTYEKAECSVCGKDIRECEHLVGKKYEGEVCRVTCYGSKLREHSLTSEPAYGEVGAGNINNVLMAAIQGGKMDMKEKKEFEAKIKESEEKLASKEKELEAKTEEITQKDKVIAEKDGEIEDLNDKISELSDKPPSEGEETQTKSPEEEETKEKLQEAEKKVQEIEEKLEKTEARLQEYVKAERKAKLEDVFDKEEHKDLIASILEENLSAKNFDRKLLELKAVKQFSASNEGSGSLPADDNNSDKGSFESLWGSSKEDFVASIVKQGVNK